MSEEMCMYETLCRGFMPVEPKHLKSYGVEDEVKLPNRATKNSAGYDFYVPFDVVIPPKSTAFMWTDVKAFMKDGEVLQMYIRSSMAIKKGLMLTNGVGIIDKDYFQNPDNDGNIGIHITNTSDDTVIIPKHTAIAQGIFMNYLESSNCNSYSIRMGGFGSTSK
jgi:dUTP pyrophosphatase